MQRIALVVDDSRVARMTLKKLLAVYHYEVVEFGSGEEAIDYLQSDNTRPDIIFMDVMMGGIDGLTATQKIKANPELTSIPVIICTGNDTEEDKNKALNVGAMTALTKPPVAETLASILAQVEKDSSAATIDSLATAVVDQVDEAALTASILAKVEQSLLAKVTQDVRGVVENSVAELVNAQMTDSLAEFSGTLTAKTEIIAEKTAQKITTELVHEAATQAVQKVIDDADITGQVTLFLSEKGDEWLGDQEEDLGVQLSAQLEQLIPDICTEYLNKNLPQIVTPLITAKAPASDSLLRVEAAEMMSHSIPQLISDVIDPIANNLTTKQLAIQALLEQDENGLDSLTAQIRTLKRFCVGLGIAVVGLLIATFM